MRYSEEPCLILARAWRLRSKSTQLPASLGPTSPHRSRPAPSRHSRPTPHVGATAAGPPRTPHRAHLAYSTALKLPLGPRNKKSAQTATFLRLAIVPNSPIVNRGIKTQAIGRTAAYYHPAATKKEPLIAKKLQRCRNFCSHDGRIASTGRYRNGVGCIGLFSSGSISSLFRKCPDSVTMRD